MVLAGTLGRPGLPPPPHVTFPRLPDVPAQPSQGAGWELTDGHFCHVLSAQVHGGMGGGSRSCSSNCHLYVLVCAWKFRRRTKHSVTEVAIGLRSECPGIQHVTDSEGAHRSCSRESLGQSLCFFLGCYRFCVSWAVGHSGPMLGSWVLDDIAQRWHNCTLRVALSPISVYQQHSGLVPHTFRSSWPLVTYLTVTSLQ